MGLAGDFVRDKTPAQWLMIAAIVLLFVSQFFLYLNDGPQGMISRGTDLVHSTQLFGIGDSGYGTGWELHPWAYVILVVLAFAFLRDDIQSSPLFSKFGWWASLVLVFACTVPGAVIRNAIGGSMGGIAFLIALVAVLVHMAEVRQQKAAAAKAAKP